MNWIKYIVIILISLVVGYFLRTPERKIEYIPQIIQGETKIDTVYIKTGGKAKVKSKEIRDTLNNVEKITVDTVVVGKDIVISLTTPDIKVQPIEVAWDFICNQVESVRVDTLRLPYPVEVHVPIEQAWYDNIETGIAIGSIITTIIFAIISK